MHRFFLPFFVSFMVGLTGSAAIAGTWTLDGAASRLAFGSIKKDNVGEVHTFERLAGTVSADGMVAIDIDLTSVETNADIRNERVRDYVFYGAATATLRATVDMDALDALPVGSSTTIYVDGVLGFLNQETKLDLEMFVLRVTDTKVLAMTDTMVFLGTADLGIDAGITKLMELAELPGITRAFPVVVRLMFDEDG